MVLIDVSFRWSRVCILSTFNLAFEKLLAQIIWLRAHWPNNQIKFIRLDNAAEFSSQSFNDYCLEIRIKVEHTITHVHTQNGLTLSLIKHLQLIERSLLMKTRLSTFICGHAILHAATLIRFRLTNYHKVSPLQLVMDQEPNISHLRILGCVVHVSLAPPNRTKMGTQRRLGIYLGFESPSIICYL